MATLRHSVVIRRRIVLRGVVQGVGFRPFVFNLAHQIGLRGFVFNSSSGLTIEIEGDEPQLDEFLKSLRSGPPPLSRIEELTSSDLPPAGFEGFEIRKSQCEEGAFVLVSPDVATCADCCNDVNDPANRRYGYPFTNCTNCGPRYTIIRDIPYDRPSTTMASFLMCAECEAEYCDPKNRRFHAQPNACSSCGPSLYLAQASSSLPNNLFERIGESSSSILANIRQLLKGGEIVAIKGLGGFQLACDARNDDAVRRLRRRKKRSDKPFALMARDMDAVRKICELTAADCELLLSPQRPIVILRAREGAGLSPAIAPGNHTLGVMLPYTPLHALLFEEQLVDASNLPVLVMTSGNISDEPIVTANSEVWQRLGKVADYFLFHNRDIYMRVDDSVARVFDGHPQVLRRSRGYAPQPIDLGRRVGELLACGAELKNTFCLTKDRYAILSQHIGDLENFETLEFFQETFANLRRLFRVEPQAVVHDLHPGYLTTRFARTLPLRQIGVQHHHAHIASCMAENHLSGPVIGVAFDGTGYGTDGQIWGGEFLIADYAHFERVAHLRYIPLPGGDTAVREPWRPALSWLREAFGSALPGELPLFQQIPNRDLALVSQMITKRVNTVSTSSCGRLFDAVASIVGLRNEVTFEGQAAIELEMAAVPGINDSYDFELEARTPAQVDMRPAIRDIVRELQRGEQIRVISSRFHNTIASVIVEVCCRIRESEHLTRVCLSGGTFQNMYLLERSVALLRNRGFEVFLHAAVPPNDGGIALGQAVIANEILNTGG